MLENLLAKNTQEGTNATFKVSAKGENLNYQWKVDKNNGVGYENIVGETSDEYTINNVALTCDGYKFICVVSNEAGNEQSKAATLHVSKKATVYDVIEGHNGKYEPESGEYTIRIDCDFSKFKDVKIDDKTVDPSNYTAKSGSTIITFKPDFMKSLSSGIHTIVVDFEDGYSATSVTVADDNGNNIDDKTTGDNKNNIQIKDVNVKTGDNTAPFVLMSIMIISGLGLVVLAKKKNYKN